MARLTILEKHELEKLAARFGISELEGTSTIPGGTANSSFLIQSPKQKYVLTVCNDKNFREIAQLTGLLNALENERFPTSRLRPTLNGVLFGEYRGLPIILKEYIEGSCPLNPTPTMAWKIGKALGNLHHIAFDGDIPNEHPYGLSHFSDVTESGINHQFIPWLSEQVDYLSQHINTTLPKSIIHGDAFFDNMIFQGENLTALIDFEEACRYYSVFDLGMCIVGTCAEDSEIDVVRLTALFKGYQTVRLLTPEELDQVLLFIQYAATATAFWRFRQYHMHHPDKNRKHKHDEMVALSNAVRKMPKATFLNAIQK